MGRITGLATAVAVATVSWASFVLLAAQLV
jgi:hypothetical protein